MRYSSMVASLALCVCTSAAEPSYDLLIRGGTYVTMDADRPLIADGYLAIANGRIAALGARDELPAGSSARRTLEAAGHLIVPGFINTHTHSAMTLLRGVADDQSLFPWLTEHMFPLEGELVSPEFVRAGTELAALEMLRSGITTFADNYFYDPVIAEVARRAGMRVVLGFGIARELAAADGSVAPEVVERVRAEIRQYSGDPLLIPGLGAHSPYRTPHGILAAARALAEEFDVPLQIHLAETQDELAEVRRDHGATPVEYLDRLGFLGPRVLAAHGVWLTDYDLQILARRGVKIAHCPESNQKLASGVSPVARLLKAGVAVGLGTDGPGSNNNLDFFETMDAAVKLARVAALDPTALDARTALELATLGGARAIGRESELGSLEVGKRADLVLIGLDRPEIQPIYDPISHLVYTLRSADVQTVIIEGRPVLEERRALGLDQKAVLAAVAAQSERVYAALSRRGWNQPRLLQEPKP